MNNEKMIGNIRKRLLFRYPHFGSIIDSVEIIENKDIPTAGTDSKKIYYNPDFVSKLSEDEQLFLFAHEVCHIAFNHIYRSKDKDSRLWNIATDAVINAFLKEDGLPLIEGGVDIKDAAKFKAEQIYQKLLEKQQKEQKKQGKSGSGKGNTSNSNGSANENNQPNSGSSPNENKSTGNQQIQSDENNDDVNNGNNPNNNHENNQNENNNKNQNNENIDNKNKDNKNESNGNGNSEEENDNDPKKNDVGHDTHSLWEKAVKELEKELEEQSKGSDEENKDKKEENKSEGDSNESEDNDSKKKDEAKGNKNELPEEIDERKEFEKNRKEIKEMLKKYQEMKANDSINAGKSSNGDEIKIADIGVSKQLVDWRKLLKEAIKYNIDWSYKNAVIEDGIVKAQLERYPIPETEIVIDTSGSVSETLIRNFLRECKNIIKVSNVKAGCFDTRFYGFQRIRSYKDIDDFKIKGRGGTNFNVAVNAFSKRVMNKIIFTDGEATMPMDDRYVIWVIFGGRKIYPKKGRVIYINDKDLYRLINDYPSKGR